MEKGLFILIGIIIAILAVILGAVYLTGGFSGDTTPTTDLNTKGIILFYGRECPHCVEVEDYIKANNIASVVQFTQSEVWHNKSNAQLLSQKVQICKITSTTVGVPFLFDGVDKCYIGGPDVINFFKNAANIK